MIKFDLADHHPEVLNHFKVNAKDRAYQFWRETRFLWIYGRKLY